MSTDERMHLTAIVVLAAALASTAAAATIMRQATTASCKLTLSVGPVDSRLVSVFEITPKELTVLQFTRSYSRTW